jgi:DNA-binding response OmpR family regulator
VSSHGTLSAYKGLTSPVNILVADDDRHGRFLLNSALSQAGHSVTEVEDGREAWETWQRDHHPLVISDWMMPDVDGLELCRRIRAGKASSLTYVILITARAGKASYLDAMDSGVDDFISKPFEKDQLLARVRVATRILGLHESLRLANTDLERRVHERTAELEKALRAKSEFLSRASHELRTPMNHILGFAQVLQWKGLSTKQEANVQHILASGRRLLTLIDRILGVAKSDPGDLHDLSFLEASATSRNTPNPTEAKPEKMVIGRTKLS